MLSEAITNKNLLDNNHHCFPVTLFWEGEDDQFFFLQRQKEKAAR